MMDLSGVAVDLSDFTAIAVFLIGALVTFWGIRKGLQLLSGGSEYKQDPKGFDPSEGSDVYSQMERDGWSSTYYNDERDDMPF